MNDAEIIRALECHQNTRPTCAECPLYIRKQPIDCLEQLQRSALNLIRRQQADIEKLATQNVKLKKCFTIEFDDNKLKKIVKKTVDRITIDIKQAENEAIREFAEKLKEKFEIADVVVTVDSKDIDNLVEETIGGEEVE